MKVKVIMNPIAGRGRAQKAKPLILKALLEYDCDVHLEETKEPNHATEIAQKAVKAGFDLILVAGGDGTINQVVNGMAESPIPLGVLCCGTGNDFAAALKMPKDPIAGVRQIMEGEISKVDLCQVNNRYFVSSVGAGFDGEVAFNVNNGFRNVGGMTAYLLSVFKTLFSYKARKVKLTVDGLVMEFNSLLVAVTNSSTYGGGIKVNPDARIDDGFFDVCAAQKMNILEIICCLPLVVAGWHQNLKKVKLLKGRDITVESNHPLYYQLDGEVLMDNVLRFSLLPQSLLIKGGKFEPVSTFMLSEVKSACAREA
ncbi:MAG TPA: hypothetical protein DDW93_04795 [Firmicutes bacterium]|nr:hypothetical protein [Bacillota bacterium]